MTEKFENLKPDNYIHYNGNCRTAINKIIPFEKKQIPTTFSECIEFCNSDKNCKGITYGYDNACTLWNPNNNTPYSKVKLNGEDLELDESYKSLTKGSPSLIADCYIKKDELNKDKYSVYQGHCLAEDSDLINKKFYYSNFNTKYTDYNECMTTCDMDPKCTGFSYAVNTGLCYLYNPSIYAKTGVLSGTDKNKIVMGDNKKNHKCYAKIQWNVVSSNIELKQLPITNNYTNIGTGLCFTDLSTLPISSVVNTVSNINECINICNNDLKCDGYYYENNGSCFLFNNTFNKNKSMGPITQAKVTSNQSNNCYKKKDMKIDTNYDKFNGNCISNDYKVPPYHSSVKDFQTCFNVCDLDVNCSGFSFDLYSNCNIYNSNTPNYNIGAENVLVQKGDLNNNKFCYVKKPVVGGKTSTITPTTTTTTSANDYLIDVPQEPIPTTSTTTGFYSFLLIDKISVDEVNISIDNFLEPYTNNIIQNIKFIIDPNDVFNLEQTTDENNNILINVNSRNPTTTTTTTTPTTPTTTTEQTFTGLQGVCRTANNLYPPWTSVNSVAFSVCKSRCENDTKCSGYSFSPTSTATSTGTSTGTSTRNSSSTSTTTSAAIKLSTIGNCQLFDMADATGRQTGTAPTGTLLTKGDGSANWKCFLVDRTVTTTRPTTTTTRSTTTRASEEFGNSYFIIKVKFNMLYENSSSIFYLANTNPMDLLTNIDYNNQAGTSEQTTTSNYIMTTTANLPTITAAPISSDNITSINNKLVIVIVCIILLLIVGLIIYLVRRKKNTPTIIIPNTVTASNVTPTTPKQ